MFNFTIDQFEEKYQTNVDILSIFKDKLLVSYGTGRHPKLLIYSTEGHQLSTVANITYVFDAMWTPLGNIVYTLEEDGEVRVISESGKINSYKIPRPRFLSVSNDNVIYLASWRPARVYQSADEGVSWNITFEITDDERHFLQVIKLSTELNDDFWAVDEDDQQIYHLRMYSMKRSHLGKNLTWRDIDVTTTDGKHIEVSHASLLSYDGNMNIFLVELKTKAIHVFSVNGQHQCQLPSSHHMTITPFKLAVDKERQLLYVGQNDGLVLVFTLTYGNGS